MNSLNMLKSESQKQIEEFMILAKQNIPDVPTVPSVKERELRANLIIEEVLETIVKGLGFVVEIRDGKVNLEHIGDGDIVELIDGCCDIEVVTKGTLSAYGVPDRPFQTAVNLNNLAKFGPGHWLREDGKLMKPPGHKPPDIAGILADISK